MARVFVFLLACCAGLLAPVRSPAAEGLPRVVLEARDPIVPDPKVPCRVQLLEASAPPAANTTLLPASVSIHGASSQAYPKKSYRLTLVQPAAWLGLPSSSQWVLNAAFIDRSLMRHKLSYDLFRSLGTPQAPRRAAQSRFVQVQLNGADQGVYLLMERVDRTLLGLRRFDSNAPSQACLYKAIDHAANFGHPGRDGFEQREPDALLQPYWRPLEEFNRFVSRATEPAFLDPVTGIVSRLDLDNAIDFHLLVLLTSNMDGITKNFLLARDAASHTNAQAGPRFFFAPWDYDATFGRNWNATPVGPDAWLSNHLFDRLHGDPAFRRRFAARWEELRKRQFATATLHGMIDGNVRTLEDAARRNEERWREAAGYYPDTLSFAEDVAQMKEWIVARTQWLDGEIRRRVP